MTGSWLPTLNSAEPVSFLGIRHIQYWDALFPSNVVQIFPIVRGIGVTWYLFVQGEVMTYLAAQVRNTTMRQIRRLAAGGCLHNSYPERVFKRCGHLYPPNLERVLNFIPGGA